MYVDHFHKNIVSANKSALCLSHISLKLWMRNQDCYDTSTFKAISKRFVQERCLFFLNWQKIAEFVANN